jgi:hypothetical protein
LRNRRQAASASQDAARNNETIEALFGRGQISIQTPSGLKVAHVDPNQAMEASSSERDRVESGRQATVRSMPHQCRASNHERGNGLDPKAATARRPTATTAFADRNAQSGAPPPRI